MPTGPMSESLGMPLDMAASSAMPQTTGQPNAAPTSQLMQLIQAISGGGGMGGPMTTMQPSPTTPSIPPHYQPPAGVEVAQGGFASTGARKRADTQAALNNLGNFSKSVTDYLHQKKVRDYSVTIEKVMNAQQGMNEAQSSVQQAQEALKANPKDLNAIAALQTAQDNLKHNQEVLSTIGADPKTAKILEKAFSVKLIGDDKGKASPEYQALQQALKSRDDAATKKAGLAMMQKFQATQPTRQQISPQYQAMAQLIKDKIIPEANEKMRFQQEILKTFSEAEQKGYDRESKEKIAHLLADAKDKATQASILGRLITEKGRLGAAEIMSKASAFRATTMANAMMQDTQWRMASEILKSKTSGKGQSQLFNNLSKEHQRITDEIKDANKELQGLGWSDRAADIIGQSKKTAELKQKLDGLRQQQQMIIQKMGQLNLGDAGSGGADQSGAAASGQGDSTADFDRFFEHLTEDDGADESSQ